MDICVAKTKALISFAVTFRTADLRLCYRICKKRFSHDAAHILFTSFDQLIYLNQTIQNLHPNL